MELGWVVDVVGVFVVVVVVDRLRCSLDVVVYTHSTVAAPVGAVVRVVWVEVGAESHDDLARVRPPCLVLRRFLAAGSVVGRRRRRLRIQEGELQTVEELSLAEEMMAVGFQTLSRLGGLGYEPDVVDGAHVEHGGGSVEAMAVLAEGFEERVGGVVVGLAGYVVHRYGGAGHEEEV